VVGNFGSWACNRSSMNSSVLVGVGVVGAMSLERAGG